MKRVVADTNILVSALQFGGKPKLLDLAADGHIDLVVSEAILAEAARADAPAVVPIGDASRPLPAACDGRAGL